ncbi:MAG: hypothetical protein ACE5FT_00715 [Candidatus Nanoarchaeia archaeon]
MKQALLIGNGEGLNWTENDVESVGLELALRGFNTKILLNEHATVCNVRLGMIKLQRNSTPDSYSLIFYSGHADEEGLQLHDEPMPPRWFFPPLYHIQGHKAVILDSCAGGRFILERVPPQTYILAASQEHQVAYENEEARLGCLTNKLLDFLSRNPGRVSLEKFGNKIMPDISVNFFDRKTYQRPAQNSGHYSVQGRVKENSDIDSS